MSTAGPYSHAVRAGGLIFLSGQVHSDPGGGGLVGDTPQERVRRCLDNLEQVAQAAGASLAGDAVRLGVFLTDLSDFPALNEVFGEYFPSDPPARAAIGVAALPLGASVEIDAVLAQP